MKVIFANGQELDVLQVTGGSRYVYGANRDTLAFIFPATESLNDLDAVFTAANCSKITLRDNDGTDSIHTGYTIRAGLTKAAVETQAESADTAAVYEDRITVAMAQKTYTETLLEGMQGMGSMYDEMAAAIKEGVNGID